jgi:hypothetical protein
MALPKRKLVTARLEERAEFLDSFSITYKTRMRTKSRIATGLPPERSGV